MVTKVAAYVAVAVGLVAAAVVAEVAATMLADLAASRGFLSGEPLSNERYTGHGTIS